MINLAPNPAWLAGVQYDTVARKHRLDNRRAPSVTQAIDARYPNRFAGIEPAVLERAAQLGTAVHTAAEYDNAGVLVEASVPVPARIRLDAWRWFRQTRRVEPLLCEAVVCSRDVHLRPGRRRPYVGRLDFLCAVDRRLVVLLDLKTGDPAFARLQTLAYLDALYQQYPALIAVDVQRWAVQLTADGRYRVHVFRDDAIDASDYRAALDAAYTAAQAEWSLPMPDTTDLAFEVPDDDPPPDMRALGDAALLFDAPEDAPVMTGPAEPAGDAAVRTGAELTAALTNRVSIAELMITPDLEGYLATLELAVAPFEAAARAFAQEMADAPITTPEQLAALGQRSLDAKEQEKRIEELFEPAIRKPRLYLDRAYAVRRRVLEFVKAGGDTAARRYTTRKRELEEADRRARVAAEEANRRAQQEAAVAAERERNRLATEAAAAALCGDRQRTADLIDQARAVVPEEIKTVEVPASQAAAAAVKGLGSAAIWKGEITDIHEAVLAAARPHLFREVAAAIDAGELTAGGGTSISTTMIATRLRQLATDLPAIPLTVFAGEAAVLKDRATADRDTLQWPGFRFYEDHTPVRRPGARGALA